MEGKKITYFLVAAMYLLVKNIFDRVSIVERRFDGNQKFLCFDLQTCESKSIYWKVIKTARANFLVEQAFPTSKDERMLCKAIYFVFSDFTM